MIYQYSKTLIDQLPETFIKKYSSNPLHLNIIFEGGLFNGSYLIGCLFYLKELEKRNLVKIEKLSGCSIGSIACILHFIDDEQISLEIYKLAYHHFKENLNLDIFEKIFKILKDNLPGNAMEKINNNVYISYYNVETGKQVVRKKYKNLDDLCETIRRSCSFPYVIDNQIYYKGKYVDGMYPYVFSKQSAKNLYLNIHNLDQLLGMISVKHENTNIHRILEGMIEIHLFFLKNAKTNICSFVDQWSWTDKLKHYLFIRFFNIVIFIWHKIFVLQTILQDTLESKNIYLRVKKLLSALYVHILRSYCV